MDAGLQNDDMRQDSGYPPREALADAWTEHSRYVGFAAGLFAFGIVVGVLLMLAGYNLLEIIEEMVGEPLFPEVDGGGIDLARFLLVNNTRAFLLSIVGALSLGLLTAWAMVFNGVIVGNVGAYVTRDVGLDYILVGLLPTGSSSFRRCLSPPASVSDSSIGSASEFVALATRSLRNPTSTGQQCSFSLAGYCWSSPPWSRLSSRPSSSRPSSPSDSRE